MGYVSDESSALREAARRRNGQFGESVHSAPDTELNALPDLDTLADLTADALDLQDEKAEATAEWIVAAMPPEAEYVHYVAVPDNSHLTVFDAYDDWGMDVSMDKFDHINAALKEIGEPYVDFDADCLLNSVGDFGYERPIGVPPRSLESAQQMRETLTAKWKTAMETSQRAVVDTLRAQMGERVDALELEWDHVHRRMWVVAAIHPNGRTEAARPDEGSFAVCNEVAKYLCRPEMTPLVRSELSGLYRLDKEPAE